MTAEAQIVRRKTLRWTLRKLQPVSDECPNLPFSAFCYYFRPSSDRSMPLTCSGSQRTACGLTRYLSSTSTSHSVDTYEPWCLTSGSGAREAYFMTRQRSAASPYRRCSKATLLAKVVREQHRLISCHHPYDLPSGAGYGCGLRASRIRDRDRRGFRARRVGRLRQELHRHHARSAVGKRGIGKDLAATRRTTGRHEWDNGVVGGVRA